MRTRTLGDSAWEIRSRDWLTTNQVLHDYVLGRLRDEGPLPLNAFEDRAASRLDLDRLDLRAQRRADDRSPAGCAARRWSPGATASTASGTSAERVLPDWTPRDEWEEEDDRARGGAAGGQRARRREADPHRPALHARALRRPTGRAGRARGRAASSSRCRSTASAPRPAQKRGPGRGMSTPTISRSSTSSPAAPASDDWGPRTTLPLPVRQPDLRPQAHEAPLRLRLHDRDLRAEGEAALGLLRPPRSSTATG